MDQTAGLGFPVVQRFRNGRAFVPAKAPSHHFSGGDDFMIVFAGNYRLRVSVQHFKAPIYNIFIQSMSTAPTPFPLFSRQVAAFALHCTTRRRIRPPVASGPLAFGPGRRPSPSPLCRFSDHDAALRAAVLGTPDQTTAFLTEVSRELLIYAGQH